MAEKNNPTHLLSQLTDLCRQVEIAAGMRPETANQFQTLAEVIFGRTGVMLSPTTLKRLWGYLREAVTPRTSTLNILAQFCGWRSYEEFIEGHHAEIESGNLGSGSIRVDIDIRPGERLRLYWHPGRMCEIEYSGNHQWKVISSEGTRLSAGDTFRCALIVSGEPLYLDDLRQPGMSPGVYVCGRRTGIRFDRPE